jgi:hypothetical protein
MHQRYAPPPLDQRWLIAMLKDQFPAHKGHVRLEELLQELVHAYMMWWLLMASFPARRIVGTAPLWEVRQIHASDLERFSSDCFYYLGGILRKESLWGGPMDFRGTRETASSINERFDFPDLVWEPLLKVAAQQRSEKIIHLR